jgi:hypothetical protein
VVFCRASSYGVGPEPSRALLAGDGLEFATWAFEQAVEWSDRAGAAPMCVFKLARPVYKILVRYHSWLIHKARCVALCRYPEEDPALRLHGQPSYPYDATPVPPHRSASVRFFPFCQE